MNVPTWNRRLPVPIHLSLVVVLVAIVAGCSRTDDGTVVIPPALDARRMDFGPFDLRHPGHIKPAETALAKPIEDYVEEILEPFPYIPVPLPIEWKP